MRYIHQLKDWPHFKWNAKEVEGRLAEASFSLGKFLGRLNSIGFEMQNEAVCETISEEILNSSAIEGERLNRDDVRSSVARRMEIALFSAKGNATRESEARADMMLDATRNWHKPMTKDRLFAWHAALFPTGHSGLAKISVGAFRDDSEGAMRVVSRRGMMERVHFVAPEAVRLERETAQLLDFVNREDETIPWLAKAAVAHLWFLTLHPFDDGNGRLARALTEYLLAKGERSAMRFFSLSAQIQREKDEYYAVLERSQRGTMDVTPWLQWFLGCHSRAVESAEEDLAAILAKAAFWQVHAVDDMNANQRKMLNMLLDGFKGNLTSSKWAKICKVSQDTASREINALLAMNILKKQGQGRSTHYDLSCNSESRAQ
ncbi:MAG: Fic family protein [Kiritimatiellae bacterium]|nr:Fic family protein [Kiritimatiellia bacterium]